MGDCWARETFFHKSCGCFQIGNNEADQGYCPIKVDTFLHFVETRFEE
jgi:hypothetical protein